MSLALTRSLQQIRFATIHHSGGSSGIPANLDQLKKRLVAYNESHSKRNYPTTKGEFGYKFLLYSFAVAGDGQWVQTQDLRYQLYHATDWYKGVESANQWGFGILLLGNFDIEPPTNGQLEAAAQIVYKFNRENYTRLIIKGHREFAAPKYATQCPGEFVGLSTDPSSKLSWIINRVNTMNANTVPEPTGLFATATALLNVRTGPATSFPKIGQLKKGEVIRVKEQVKGASVDGVSTWCKFWFNGVDGFVHSNWLVASSSAPAPAPAPESAPAPTPPPTPETTPEPAPESAPEPEQASESFSIGARRRYSDPRRGLR